LIGAVANGYAPYGVVGIAIFTAWAAYCAASTQGAHGTDVIPSLVGGLAAAGAFVWLSRERGAETGESVGLDRRQFLTGAAGLAAAAAFTGVVGRWAQNRHFSVAARRTAITLPTPTSPAVVPTGADLHAGGQPWQTPNSSFYRVDTVVYPPQVDPDSWKLRIHGMVDRPIELTYADLLKRPMIERWITLNCVSNTVGGPYVGNARWLGTRLADLLRESGVRPESDQLLMGDVNGTTIGAPTKVVMDGRDALLAVGMNGEPLPVAHGFPVRVVVPGLYGYVSACKWVIDIEATTYAQHAYWVDRGWAAQPDLQLASRIDTPRDGAVLSAGKQVAVAGVAWDQHVGVSAVEVQVDGGPWQRAELAPVPSADTWRQWVYRWTAPAPGAHKIRVRATDATGQVQTGTMRYPGPEGATGWHEISVQVG
jgi:DMSO/TMAO reductase YedYZ molybdopterin-dependent catalytic subunit